ncbi:YgaP-like transmembrane domain [Peribacillus sp. SCS-155]|uniref:YgaP-like transmembrane domain n=1 Tax=Peribacillus sedimenti TaxID=3115297 RepID=UPI0039068DE2
MQFKQNISIMNALIRITCGFTMLAWATARLSRKRHRDSYLVAAMLGGMKVGEGMLRYCPLTDLYEQSRVDSQDEEQSRNISLQ